MGIYLHWDLGTLVLLYTPIDYVCWNSVAYNAVILECRSRAQLDAHVPAIVVARQQNAAAYSRLDEVGPMASMRLATAWVSLLSIEILLIGLKMSIDLVL